MDDTCFKVSVIPHTARETTLLSKSAGDRVNLENDVIGKYVGKLIRTADVPDKAAADSGLDADFLMKHGYL